MRIWCLLFILHFYTYVYLCKFIGLTFVKYQNVQHIFILVYCMKNTPFYACKVACLRHAEISWCYILPHITLRSCGVNKITCLRHVVPQRCLCFSHTSLHCASVKWRVFDTLGHSCVTSYPTLRYAHAGLIRLHVFDMRYCFGVTLGTQ